MAEAKRKQKWIVYLHRLVFDIMEDPNQEVHHRHPVGTTYAVSEEQAINNVRFRTGAKEYTDQYSVAWLEAFTEDKDPGALNDWVYAWTEPNNNPLDFEWEKGWCEIALDYVRSAEEAASILVDLVNTPKLRSLRFTFLADVNGVPTVDYHLERFVYADAKIEPVLDESGNNTGEYRRTE